MAFRFATPPIVYRYAPWDTTRNIGFICEHLGALVPGYGKTRVEAYVDYVEEHAIMWGVDYYRAVHAGKVRSRTRMEE